MKTQKMIKYILFAQIPTVLLISVVSVTTAIKWFGSFGDIKYDFSAGQIEESYDESEEFMADESEEYETSNLKMAKKEAPKQIAGSSGSVFLNTANASQTVNSKYIVKTGSINGKVSSLKEVKNQLPGLLQKNKAYISNENENNSSYRINLYLTVRVPSENFEVIMDEIAALAVHIDSKSSNLDDVMKEFVETEERIKSKQILRTKFRNLLRQSKRVEDTLQIERELAGLQEEIESSKKYLNELKDKISLSTINVSFFEEKPRTINTTKVSFFRQISNAVVDGWNSMRNFVLGAISFWPLWILLGIGYFGFRRWRKKRDK